MVVFTYTNSDGDELEWEVGPIEISQKSGYDTPVIVEGAPAEVVEQALSYWLQAKIKIREEELDESRN